MLNILAEYRLTTGEVGAASEVTRTGKYISLIYAYSLALGPSVPQ
jgi:hypothetical protein